MRFYVGVVAVVTALTLTSASLAVDLFVDDFDVDHTADWTVNSTYFDVPASNSAKFFFDYSTVGIPSAPNSVGGTTRGLNLQANQDADFDGVGVGGPLPPGLSVSPNGQSFTGDYKLTFDWWVNFPGPLPAGSSGTSQLSYFGIGTSGTFDQYPGHADGVWFASTLDGGSGADYRAYSQERQASYQFPADPAVLDGMGQPVDSHATYHAGTRNNTGQLYLDTFGGQTPPAAQVALFPQQTGETADGTPAFAWHEVEISKIGNIIDWKVNGTSLITIDGTNFVTALGGSNILFGHGDINVGASSDVERFNLLFSLIDNVKVSTIDTVGNTPDFNGLNGVDAADYTIWRDNLGLMDSATQETGDANGDLNVDSTDYDLWKAAFGTFPGSGSLSSAPGVPEPSTLLLVGIGIAAMSVGRRRS